MKKYFLLLFLVTGCSSLPKQEPLDTIKNFLSWYGTHYKEANAFGLVNQGDSVFYAVNFEETEKFLAYMKTSGFVSDVYLENFRTYFKQADDAFKKDPINEGPPPGFDYDIVLFTQEPELVIEKGGNPTIIFSSVRDDVASIALDVYMNLEFTLSKSNGKWMIDRIMPTEGD